MKISYDQPGQCVSYTKALVTLCIEPFGDQTELFLSWLMDDVLRVGNVLCENSSLIFEVELSRRLKGTGFELHETCNYGHLFFGFYLPLKSDKSASEEMAELEKIVSESVTAVIKKYSLEKFWAIYTEMEQKRDILRNEKGILDLTDPFGKKNNVYALNNKIRRVFEYLALRLSRGCSGIQTMLTEVNA